MTTHIFDPDTTTIDDILAFVGAADIGGAFSNFASISDAAWELRQDGAWMYDDGSYAEWTPDGRIRIGI